MNTNTTPVPYTNDETLSMFVNHLIELGNQCNRSLISLNPETGTYKTWSNAINNFINEFHEMSFGNHDEFLVALDLEAWPAMVSGEEIMLEPDCLPVIEVEKVDEYVIHFATLDMDEENGEEYFGLLWYISLGKIARKINQLDTFDEKKTFLFIRELLVLLELGDENFDRFNVITTQRPETYEKSVKLNNRFHKDSVFFIAKYVSKTSQTSIQIFDSLLGDIK